MDSEERSPADAIAFAGMLEMLDDGLFAEPLTLNRALVNGSQRLELAGFSPARLSWYKAQGCFTEIIRYQTRLFVPACRAAEVLQRLTGPGEPSRSILQTIGQRR